MSSADAARAPEQSTLDQLFPRGFGQHAWKIAGTRKPRNLMLDV